MQPVTLVVLVVMCVGAFAQVDDHDKVELHKIAKGFIDRIHSQRLKIKDVYKYYGETKGDVIHYQLDLNIIKPDQTIELCEMKFFLHPNSWATWVQADATLECQYHTFNIFNGVEDV